ncbi:MAG: hypothetical protein LJE68_18720, partial [Rhodobacter sp.]|nr:hypothetical protein [Rhodobacter sp.]
MSKPILFCAAVACALATLASAEPTDDALLSQDPDKLEFVPTPDSVLELTDKDPTEEYLARYGDVQRFFSLMDEPQSEEALNQILDRMRRDRSTAGRVMELYKQLGEAANPENGFFAEARWRSLYLLGELGSTDTVAFFAELAASPLPKPG